MIEGCAVGTGGGPLFHFAPHGVCNHSIYIYIFFF